MPKSRGNKGEAFRAEGRDQAAGGRNFTDEMLWKNGLPKSLGYKNIINNE